MSKIHEKIVKQVISDFSVGNRGRLFSLKQGYGVPQGSNHPIKFGTDNGFPDVFGDIVIYTSESDITRGSYSGRVAKEMRAFPSLKPCTIEVKTLGHPTCQEEQKDMIEALSRRGWVCFIAMELEDKSERLYDLIKWEDFKAVKCTVPLKKL